ncbi:hypothetical protein [Streptomyces radicis]|uniref:Uncharacterized protein n=1 Tax=Streptomyces radicis TaxID=1750517 RepID=A0A3A9WBN6_9ACTN|nr:hypothetical protein [Streptomyces radicis]RKN10170.1 hypothetical protein D7319_10465 [Streptomyces radicis]RKN24512.1 hypothetical protein D7318_11645 [Streptomyces radicis]
MTSDGTRPARFEQAELPHTTPLTHREVDGVIRTAYDPRHVTAMEARARLGTLVDFTEGPGLDLLRRRYAESTDEEYRTLTSHLFEQLDGLRAPDAIDAFHRVFSLAQLHVLAESRGLRITHAEGPTGHFLTEALIVEDLLLIPPGQPPEETLRDLTAADPPAARVPHRRRPTHDRRGRPPLRRHGRGPVR